MTGWHSISLSLWGISEASQWLQWSQWSRKTLDGVPSLCVKCSWPCAVTYTMVLSWQSHYSQSPGHPHQEAKDKPVGLLSNCITCLTWKGVPCFSQRISTFLSSTAVCQAPTPELYLRLCPLLSWARPWAEQLLSFASRACSLGRVCEVILCPWTTENKREEKHELDSVSWKKFGQTSLSFWDPSCVASSMVPRAQNMCLWPAPCTSWQWSHQHWHQQLHPYPQVLVLASPCALYPLTLCVLYV